MSKTVHNPSGLFNSLQYGFSQIVVAQGQRTVHISGQVAWDANGQIAGKGDLRTQTWQSLENLALALHTVGGTLADVAALRIYIAQSELERTTPIKEGLLHFFPQNPPASTWIGVPGLASPDFLIEIEAIAYLD